MSTSSTMPPTSALQQLRQLSEDRPTATDIAAAAVLGEHVAYSLAALRLVDKVVFSEEILLWNEKKHPISRRSF
jgi:hypothetical protein